MTITMDDEALNGTNRVVLDGVMTQTECDKILQLATVRPHIKTPFSVQHGDPHFILRFLFCRLLRLLEMVTKDGGLHTHLMRRLRVLQSSGL